MPQKTDKLISYAQSDGTVTVKNVNWHEPVTQLSFSTTATTGTITVRVKYHPDADFENPEDSVLVVDVTNLKSHQFYDAWLYSFEFTPTGLDGTYTPCICAGRMYESLR